MPGGHQGDGADGEPGDDAPERRPAAAPSPATAPAASLPHGVLRQGRRQRQTRIVRAGLGARDFQGSRRRKPPLVLPGVGGQKAEHGMTQPGKRKPEHAQPADQKVPVERPAGEKSRAAYGMTQLAEQTPERPQLANRKVPVESLRKDELADGNGHKEFRDKARVRDDVQEKASEKEKRLEQDWAGTSRAGQGRPRARWQGWAGQGRAGQG